MSDEEKTERPKERAYVKTLRISRPQHEAFTEFQYENRCKSADAAMALLLNPAILRIPMPVEVMDRWRVAAAAAGFPLEQWVAQRVEGFLAIGAEPSEIRGALDELLDYHRAMQVAGIAYAAHQGQKQPFQPCAVCTTPTSCEKGRQDPEKCE